MKFVSSVRVVVEPVTTTVGSPELVISLLPDVSVAVVVAVETEALDVALHAPDAVTVIVQGLPGHQKDSTLAVTTSAEVVTVVLAQAVATMLAVSFQN